MSSVATADLWDAIARDASEESSLWRDALRPDAEREPVFSSLGDDRFAIGLETIYEGYLVHYGSPRLFAAPDADTALLLGDYLYAHGLVRIASNGSVALHSAIVTPGAGLLVEGFPVRSGLCGAHPGKHREQP